MVIRIFSLFFFLFFFFVNRLYQPFPHENSRVPIPLRLPYDAPGSWFSLLTDLSQGSKLLLDVRVSR